MSRLVKCKYCGEYFDRDKEEWDKVGTRYAHSHCIQDNLKKLEQRKREEELERQNNINQYHEVLDFAQFGSDLDNATKETINHGQHLTELLKQKQYSPMSLSEMTIMLFANQKGFVDQIALNRVSEYEKGLLSNIKSFHGDVIEQIETNKSLSESLLSRLEEIIKEYTAQFVLE